MIRLPHPTLLEVSEHQREKYACLYKSESNLLILEGGPGTGKTYTAAAIIKAMIKDAGGFLKFGMCAPTGKAAIRLEQLMGEHGIDHAMATTIHRMLGVRRLGYDGGGWGFHYNAGNKLPFDVIVVDEASMLSTDLGASLFQAISPSSIVLLVGDTGQLLPVGHGCPLRDFLDAGVPSARLTEIRRSSGDIAFACRDMAKSGAVKPSAGRNLGLGENWWHFDSGSAAQTQSMIVKLVANPPARWTANDIQILSTLNDSNSPLSRKRLNEAVAPVMNPSRKSRPKETKFGVGDKVMCIENNGYEDKGPFAMPAAGNKRPTVFVANGEIGEVKRCDKESTTVAFSSPDRLCRFAFKEQEKIQLAYAVTCHKSQGSQWPVVIYPIDDSAGARFLASRELVYTAISRQQELTITIGRIENLKKACSKVRIRERKTFLAEDICHHTAPMGASTDRNDGSNEPHMLNETSATA